MRSDRSNVWSVIAMMRKNWKLHTNAAPTTVVNLLEQILGFLLNFFIIMELFLSDMKHLSSQSVFQVNIPTVYAPYIDFREIANQHVTVPISHLSWFCVLYQQ